MESRITEQPSEYNDLDKKSVDELIHEINQENMSVPYAVEKALPELGKLISAIEDKLRNGGRLFYCGCGTGGRLCILDTIEVQNTYGTDKNIIQAIFPGGLKCITHTLESREDDTDAGWRMLQKKGADNKDIVVGFSASGTTPFVLSTLIKCKEHGIQTGSVVNNPHSPITQNTDFSVVAVTGPEYVTGSTRMKAGTSQKIILDMISSTVLIRLGRVEGNRMINARLINKKLIDRAVRIFMERNPKFTDYDYAKQLLLQHGSVKQTELFLKENED